MEQLEITELWEIEFEILNRFKVFCDENNITYYLANGTLLGAVKYKDFIPWDDDIDIFVPRKDYDRLIELFQDDSKYALFSYERNKNFLFPFAKLCDMTTRKEEFVYNGVDLGVDIDIFPLDAWNNNPKIAKKELKKISRYISWLRYTKLKKPDSKNFFKNVIKAVIMFFCKKHSSQFFVEKIIENVLKDATEEFENAKYLGSKSWCIYGKSEIIPSEVFADKVELEFHGSRFSAPAGYDIYLKGLYGDYKKEPPKEKQKTHHSFWAYKK